MKSSLSLKKATAVLFALFAISGSAYSACTEYTDTNYNHKNAGRAYVSYSTYPFQYYATGSDNLLGSSMTSTTIHEDPTGYYALGACPSGPTAPTFTFHTFSVDGDSITVTGTIADPDGDVTEIGMFIDNSIIPMGSCTTTPNFVCTHSGLLPGTHDYVLNALDAQGLRSEYTDPVQFVVEAELGDAPAFDGYSLLHVDNELTFQPREISITDADGNLALVSATVSDESSVIANLNCTFALVSGSTTEYEATCDQFTLPSWGIYTIDMQADDAAGNSTANEPFEFTATFGSSAPQVTITGHSFNGTVITVDAIVTDADGDLDFVTLATSFFYRADCTNVGSSYSCTWDAAELAGQQISFQVISQDALGQYGADDVLTQVPAGASCFTATNSAHATAGRAYKQYTLYYATGSSNYLGYSASATTSLEETSSGVWTKVTSCP